MLKEVKTDKAQSAKGLLSQAVMTENLIFTAGFIHSTPEGEVVNGTITEEFEQVVKNVNEVLIAAGSNLQKVIKVTLYVTDIEVLPELNKSYVQYFEEPLPAREAVCVKALPLKARIEMSVVASR